MGNKIALYGINLVALIFNLSLSLTFFVVPLYGVYLGLSASYIGFLISLPGFFQLTFRLVGGALSDALGEKTILVLTFGGALVAGIFYSYLAVPIALIMGQVFMGIARSVYWTGTQSYATRIPGVKAGKSLGNLSSFVNIGRILGVIVGGWAIQTVGYELSFQSIIWTSTVGLVIVVLLPKLPQKSEKREFLHTFTLIPGALKYKPLQMGLLAAFVAGTIVALTESFFPVWLKDQLGFQEGLVSVIITLRGIGAVVTGAAFGYTLGRLGNKWLLTLECLAPGAILLLIPFFASRLPATVIVAAIGLVSGSVMVHYQVIAADHSTEENRGLAMAVVGLAWSLAYMLGPFTFGVFIDHIGIQWSFFLLGIILVAFAIPFGRIYDYLMPPFQANGKNESSLRIN